MKAFNIIHTYKHKEGHLVTETINKAVIFAEDSDTAIEMFKDLSPKLGRYIQKDEDGFWGYGHNLNSIKAVEIDL